jgi:beta-N-acetylhexosaminidase
MTANLRHAAGSLLVVGLAGAELTGLERAWLRLVRPAGIILFRRNIADARQTRALLDDATALCAPHSLRCVDVEGGTVDRLRDALAPMPSARAVAMKALLPTLSQRTRKDGAPTVSRLSTVSQETRKDGAPAVSRLSTVSQKARKDGARSGDALMREHGELIALGVQAFGFNTTLAPVLDLALPASAQVMGTRVVAPDAAGVIDYARNFLAGLAAHGVAGCGKHFPGLGGGALDSHLETPAIRRNFEELWREDLAPYRELRDQLPMMMVNHAAYPETPGGNRPASASPFWIKTVLRERIGYRGIVFSDDMEMGGILKFLPIEEAAIAAIRAGMDLLEICHSAELILRAYEALVEEAERSAAFCALLLARASATARKRAALFANSVPAELSDRQFAALRDRVFRFGERIGEPPATTVSPATKVEGA